jgi:hypothetical protein
MMERKAMFRALVLLALMGLAASALAQGPLSPGQEKLMAKRAAQADGYRKLMEEIKGLHIDSQTYVRDYVAESDQIATAFSDYMKGMKLDGPPRYMPDGTCEVDVKVTLKQIMQCLKRINLDYPDPKRTRMSFDKMGQYTKKTVFKVTGVGVPPGQKAEATAPKGVSYKTAGVPGWENVTPQGRLLAERGALTDARRNLAETVKGLKVTGDTLVRDFVVLNDQIQTNLNTFINGVKEAGPYRYLPDGICEVDVEVTIQDVVKELNTIRQHYYAGFPPHSVFRETTFESILGWGPPKVIKATGNAAIPAKGYLKGRSAGQTSDAGQAMPSWASETVKAKGTGVPKEGETGTAARLNAERAAETVARRNLVEKVYGVHIDATTTVLDYMTVNDKVKAEVSRFLAGAQMVGKPTVMPDGSIEVEMELPLSGLWQIVSGGQLAKSE